MGQLTPAARLAIVPGWERDTSGAGQAMLVKLLVWITIQQCKATLGNLLQLRCMFQAFITSLLQPPKTCVVSKAQGPRCLGNYAKPLVQEGIHAALGPCCFFHLCSVSKFRFGCRWLQRGQSDSRVVHQSSIFVLFASHLEQINLPARHQPTPAFGII